MSDVSIESKSAKKDFLHVGGAEFNRERKLPTSLLKQAIASEKIQESLNGLKTQNRQAFDAEKTPSIETLLEDELCDAYEAVLDNDIPMVEKCDDKLLSSALEAESACRDFIEEALAEHLDVSLGGLLPAGSGAPPNPETGRVENMVEPQETVASQDRGPEYLTKIPEETENTRSTLAFVDMLKARKASIITAGLAGTLLVGGIYFKPPLQERFGQVIASTTGFVGDKDSQLQAFMSSALVEATEVSKADATTEAGTVTTPAMKTSVRVIEDQPASAQTGATARPTVQEVEPIAVTAKPSPTPELDLNSIASSRLKNAREQLARLEKRMANPGQQKTGELQQLIAAKAAEIARFESAVGRQASYAGDPVDRPVAAAENTEMQKVSDKQTEPDGNTQQMAAKPDTDISTDPISTAAAPQQASEEQAADKMPSVEELKIRFQETAAMRNLSDAQQSQLAVRMAGGECVVPAATAVFTRIPTLVMRDLVRSFPDHC